MRERRIFYNYVASVAGIVVGFGLAEVATRLVAPQPFAESWYVNGPQGILINKPSSVSRHEIGGRIVTYETNSKHQRNRAEPNPQAVRVLILGDSFTLGIGLALEETYVDIFRKQLEARTGPAAFQLLNAATGGWGTADQLVYLEAFGDDLKPSAVVVFLNFDDLRRSVERDVFVVSADGRELVSVDRSERQSFLKTLIQNNRTYGYLLEHSHFVRLLRQSTRYLGVGTVTTPLTDDPDPEELALEQTLARLLFRRMAAWCEARNVKLTVLTTGWPSIEDPWLPMMLREEGIYFRDLRGQVADVIGDNSDAFEIADDGHPNARGALLIKNAAWPILESRLADLAPHPTP